MAVNIPSANVTQDTELASYVTAISLRLDALVGPIVKRTVTDEPHDGGQASIRTRFYPVDSVTVLIERRGTTAFTIVAENFATPTALDYDIDLAAGIIYRRNSNADTIWAVGRRNVLVTYVAGRFADTASVDQRFKQAAAITLTHLWRKEQGANPGPYAQQSGSLGVPGWAVPRSVSEMLSDQLLAPVCG